MDRRNFLRSLVGGVAAAAAVRTWPFRVYSFPSVAGALRGLLYYQDAEGHWLGLERSSHLQFNGHGGYLGRGSALERALGFDETLPEPIASPLDNFLEDPVDSWRRKLLGA